MLSFAGPRRRDARGSPRRTSPREPGSSDPSACRRGVEPSRARLPRSRSRRTTVPVAQPSRFKVRCRSNGCQASLARGPRGASGLPVAGELRDLAARHRPRRRRRPALPDRRPERLRQGLAREPLPLADLPDARPDRRLQRPGRVRRQPRRAAGDRRGRRLATATRASGDGHGHHRPPRADAGRWRRGRSLAEPQPPLHLRELHRRLGEPARARGVACPSPSDPVMPTTRSSCTAGSASARPT